MPVHAATDSPLAPPPLLVVLLSVVFLALYVRFVIYFLEDLYRPERRVNGGNKDLWAVIIVFGSILGIMAYLLIGREG